MSTVDELEDVVGRLVIAPQEIGRAHRVRDRYDARLMEAEAAFDAARLWDLDSRTSMRDWLRGEAGMAPHEAGRRASRSRRLAGLPLLRDAVLDGDVSMSKATIVLGRLTKARLADFAAEEHLYVPLLESMDARQVEVFMAQWVAAWDDANPQPGPDEPESWLNLDDTIAERGELRGSLDPASKAVVAAGLHLFETRDAVGEPRTPGERRAQALVDMARFALDQHDKPAKRRHAPHVSLVITPEQLEHGRCGRTLDGVVVPAADAAAWACDSVVRRIVMAGGEILDLGREVRTVTGPLFQAVAARDGGCRFGDCDRPGKHCDAHHVIPWWAGGRTSVGLLVLLCRRHHRRIHTPGWAAKLLVDGTFEVTTPTGRVITSKPPDLSRAGPP